MSAEEAQVAGVTVPLQVVIMNVSRDYEARTRTGAVLERPARAPEKEKAADGDDDVVSPPRNVRLSDAEVAVAVDRLAREHGCRRALVFHTTNENATNFVDACDEVFASMDSKATAVRVSGGNRVIQRRFNVGVMRARLPGKTFTLRDRSER